MSKGIFNSITRQESVEGNIKIAKKEEPLFFTKLNLFKQVCSKIKSMKSVPVVKNSWENLDSIISKIQSRDSRFIARFWNFLDFVACQVKN